MAVDREFDLYNWALLCDPGPPRPGKQGREAEQDPKWLRNIDFSQVLVTFSHKRYQQPYVFGHRLEKIIKNFAFLKVETLKFDRGRSFEIAKRSSSIGVSNSSKNEHPCGSSRSTGSCRWSAVPTLLASRAGVRITAVLTNSLKLLSAKDMICQTGSDILTSCPRYDESAGQEFW